MAKSLCISMAALVLSVCALAEAPLRYTFEPGQHLTYELIFRTSDADGTLQYTIANSIDLWILEAVDTGGWQTLVTNTRTFQRVGQDPGNSEWSTAVVPIGADGRFESDPMSAISLRLSDVIVPLPASDAELESGWQITDETDQAVTKYHVVERGTDDMWKLEIVEEGPMTQIYETKGTKTVLFDGAKGRVASGESQFEEWAGRMSSTTTTLMMTHQAKIPSDMLAELAADARVFSTAMATYAKQTFYPTGKPKEIMELMKTAESDLRAATAGIESDVLRKQLEKTIERHTELAEYLVEEATTAQVHIGKPAPDWEYPDLDGKKHALADYRGKVLVLDFWYRGCGWCIRAMPQLKATADSFKDKPVAFIGVNVDRDEADARFVVEKLDLPYVNILTGPMGGEDSISAKHGVQAYPTIVIIDQEGIVQYFHVGYRPSLKDDLTKKIEGLLNQ